MITVMLIAANRMRFSNLLDAAVNCPALHLVQTSHRYPTANELTRLVDTSPPDVILLDQHNVPATRRLRDLLRLKWPEVPVVGVSGQVLPALDDVKDNTISYPCTSVQLRDAIIAALHPTPDLRLYNAMQDWVVFSGGKSALLKITFQYLPTSCLPR